MEKPTLSLHTLYNNSFFKEKYWVQIFENTKKPQSCIEAF